MVKSSDLKELKTKIKIALETEAQALYPDTLEEAHETKKAPMKQTKFYW